MSTQKYNPLRAQNALSICLTLLMLTFGTLTLPASSNSTEKANVCLENVCFANEVNYSSEDLVLRGAGTFRYWGFRVYTAALYVDENLNAEADVLDNHAKKLVIHYHREIERKDLIRSTRELIRNHPNNDYESLVDRLRDVYNMYETVDEGDEYTIAYTPSDGTTILLNGEEKLTIPGQDFARAFFGIWLSDHSVGEDFRDRLVGEEPIS